VFWNRLSDSNAIQLAGLVHCVHAAAVFGIEAQLIDAISRPVLRGDEKPRDKRRASRIEVTMMSINLRNLCHMAAVSALLLDHVKVSAGNRMDAVVGLHVTSERLLTAGIFLGRALKW
jgi:hypothetical protein